MPYVSPRRPLPPGRILATAPSPDPEPEPMPTRLPNDDQMRNAQARIHVEGFLGHLQRPGGIFDAPPGDSLITDPQRSDVRIDDRALSVWTGRYVRHFAAAPPSADPHETAIRRVLQDLYNSDEARQKRGGGDDVGTGPFRVLEGQVAPRADGSWQDDRGRFVPLLLHFGEAFSAYVRGKAVRGRLSLHQSKAAFAAGYPVDLVWGCLGYDGGWAGREVGPVHQGRVGWRDALIDYLREKARIGLQTFYSTGDWLAAGNPDTYIEDLAAVLHAVGPGVVFAVELNNESWHNGADASTLATYARRLKARVPWIPVCLSAPPPEPSRDEIRSWSTGADFQVVHSWRGGDLAMKLRRLWNEIYEAGTYHETRRVPPAINKEPAGPQPPGDPTHPYRPGQSYVTAQDGSHELDDEGVALLAGTTWAAGMGFAYFSGWGAYWDGPLEEQAGFRAPLEILPHVPPQLLQAGSTLAHGGEREGSRRVYAVPANDDTRADHILAPDGSFLCSMSGPRWRECRAVRGHEELWTRTFERGRLVIGRA